MDTRSFVYKNSSGYSCDSRIAKNFVTSPVVVTLVIGVMVVGRERTSNVKTACRKRGAVLLPLVFFHRCFGPFFYIISLHFIAYILI